MEREKADHVVVDAVAFFKNVQLQNFAKNIYTVHAVVREIKDASTRQRLAVLPYELKFRQPSSESIQFVSDFARKTGEYQSLSPVDIQVMALAHQLTKEHLGTDHLKSVPETQKTFSSNRRPLEKSSDIVGFYFPSEGKQSSQKDAAVIDGDVPLELTEISTDTERAMHDTPSGEGSDNTSIVNRNSGEDMCDTDNMPTTESGSEDVREIEIESRRDEMKSEDSEGDMKNECEIRTDDGMEKDAEVRGESDDVEEDQGEEEDDDVGWITPQNLQKARNEMHKDVLDDLKGVTVSCMTTDFAMQNVLIQIGIPALSVDGMIIKKAKSFALRCYACFKVTSDTNRLFCPKCGNQTLNKVIVTVDDDGNTHYHISKRRGFKVGELRRSLPLPQGGKHAVNPIVCEDQPQPQNRVSRKAMARNNVFDPDYVAQNSPFVTRDVTSRSAILGVGRKQQKRRGKRK